MNDDNLVHVNKDRSPVLDLVSISQSACPPSLFSWFESQARDPHLSPLSVDMEDYSPSDALKNFSEGSVIEGMSQRKEENVFQVQILIFLKP